MSEPQAGSEKRSEVRHRGASGDSLVGVTLAGRFRVLEVIARGGMGTVYKAEQLPLGRTCAIKTMHPSPDPQEADRFRRRFFKEASVAASLRHPNSVAVFDYGNEGDLFFIAMEYVAGQTLKEVLAEEGRLEPARALRIAIEIARSLREAHALGVVHRDIKPSNVAIVDRADELDSIKVLDFGLVKDFDGANVDTLGAGELWVGSPAYMAPEQANGDEISPATDIYSLGVVLFEMLCGRPPFVKKSDYALVVAHISEPAPCLGDVIGLEDVPTGVEDVVARCLSKKPGDRYGSLDELLVELQRISCGQLSLSSTVSMLLQRGRRTDGEPSAQQEARSSGPCASISTKPSVITARGSRPTQAKAQAPLLVTVCAFGVALLLAAAYWPFRAVGGPHGATFASSAPLTSSSPVGGPEDEVPPEQALRAVAVADRIVRVETVPPGAAIRVNDLTLCEATPCDLDFGQTEALSAERRISVELAGYVSQVAKVRPDDCDVRVILKRLERKPIRGRASRGGASGGPTPLPTGFKLSPY